MKVLFVLNSGFDTPGPSNHLLEAIAEALIADGCRVHIIEKHKTGKNPDIPAALAGSVNLSYDVCKVKNVDKTSFFRRYLADVRYAFSCIKYYIKNKDCDVVFLQSCNTAFFQVILLKILLRKPIVYNVQDIFPLNARNIGVVKSTSLLFAILRGLQRLAYRYADKIITISEDMQQTLAKENVDVQKIEVVYNWSYSDETVSIDNKDNKFIKMHGIQDDHYKVVYAGNIGAVQNVDILIRAAELLQNETMIRFYIIGEGVQKRDLMKYVVDRGLENVKFYPMQAPDYATHIYSMADINIIPLSKGIIKTALPSKTATCLACGKPIIACIDLDSAFRKMLESCEMCSVVDSDDAQGLAQCIQRYYKKGVKGQFADEVELFNKVFSKSENAKTYADIIQEMVV